MSPGTELEEARPDSSPSLPHAVATRIGLITLQISEKIPAGARRGIGCLILRALSTVWNVEEESTLGNGFLHLRTVLRDL